MAITLWRRRRPFEGLTRWFDDLDSWFDDDFFTETLERKYRMERTYGSFQRSFRVPESVTEKDIKAKYHDGVLEMTIPAPKEEKPKAIDVKIE